MSVDGVDPDEMTPSHPLDDRAVEAFIAGSTDGIDALAPLTTFADDLRVSASGPAPAPHGLLLRMVTEGFSTEKGGVPATAATNVPTSIGSGPAQQVAGPPSWRKRKMTLTELLAGLAAKLAGLGMAAKAGLGLGVAAASVAGAGSVGILPDPVQHAVASVVNATTSLQLPDPGAAVTALEDGTDDLPDVTGVTPTVAGGGTDDDAGTDEEGTDEEGTEARDNHGACVSAIAKDKSATADGSHGRAVSEAAHSDCGKGEDDETTSTTTSSTTTTVGGTTSTTGGEDESDGTDRGPGNGKGNGKGNGNGNGNSGSNRP